MITNTMVSPAELLPKVGDKGYYAIGTDVYPVTAIEVSKKGKRVRVRFEKFEGDKENGHDYFGIQKWNITENPNGNIETAYWSDRRQRYVINQSGTVKFTGWKAKQDPSF